MHEYECSDHGRSRLQRCRAHEVKDLLYTDENWKDTASFALTERNRIDARGVSTEYACDMPGRIIAAGYALDCSVRSMSLGSATS